MMVHVLPLDNIPLFSGHFSKERMRLFCNSRLTGFLKFLKNVDQLFPFFFKFTLINNNEIFIGWKILVKRSFILCKFFLYRASKEYSDHTAFQFNLAMSSLQRSL